MSQRNSGYTREDRDLYQTPAWVTEALIPHLPRLPNNIWEPAAGEGKMADVLAEHCSVILSTDIVDGMDFLETMKAPPNCSAIITNPPYALASAFIVHALSLMYRCDGFVAMLLRTDYDHAKTRQVMFRDSSIFHKKVVLTKRIIWFEDQEVKASPSYNHAWFIWDWQNKGAPTLAYQHDT